MKRFRMNKKAVSPVIATIIIVAIAIVMSIAVAYWLLGLGSSFTKYEKIEFTAAYVDVNAAGDYVVTMDVKNTGSAAATVDPAYILYNGKPHNALAYVGDEPLADFDGAGANDMIAVTLQPGGAANPSWTLTLPKGTVWTSGMTVEIMLHSTAGKDYPKVITLP